MSLTKLDVKLSNQNTSILDAVALKDFTDILTSVEVTSLTDASGRKIGKLHKENGRNNPGLVNFIPPSGLKGKVSVDYETGEILAEGGMVGATAKLEVTTGNHNRRPASIRDHGESEVRGDPVQIGKHPGIFQMDHRGVHPALVLGHTPLSNSEYFNRKMKHRQADPEPGATNKVRKMELRQVEEPTALNEVKIVLPAPPASAPAPVAKEDEWRTITDRDGVVSKVVPERSISQLEALPRFFLEDVEDFVYDASKSIDRLLLPYPKCLFVVGRDKVRAIIEAEEVDNEEIRLTLLTERKSKEYPWGISAIAKVSLKDNIPTFKWINSKTVDPRMSLVNTVVEFIRSRELDDVLIETVEAPLPHEIPPPKPGYSFRIVSMTIGAIKRRKAWQGGTHASPREHKRCGHWRPGKNGPIWIPATIVNKGTIGRVDKEYHVSKITKE